MENLIYEYYVKPIWDHSGYNIVNTLTYAIIAIAAVFLIYRFMKGRIKIDEKFITATLMFVLFGSTLRVVTDSIDSHIFSAATPIHQAILDSHLLDYGYFTVTPGIYVVVAALFILSAAILYRIKRMELLQYVGIALWLPHFLLLLPFMKYAIYAVSVLALAAIPAYLAWRYFKNIPLALIVAGQALDGAATFFVIDYFSKISGIQYFEQHVFSAAIGALSGTFFTFYLLKVGISFSAAYLLSKEKMDIEDLNYIALILIIMGFAPGIRDVLRMVVGA